LNRDEQQKWSEAGVAGHEALVAALGDPVDLGTVTSLGTTVGRIAEGVATLRDCQRTLDGFPEDPQDLAAAAESAAADAEIAALESAERAPALVQLASSAIGLLGDLRPVCEQPIDEVSVRSHLQEILDPDFRSS
ncbi:MAG: hypothetical protein M3Q52_11435, partial [Pseudomonadota bacterium]|nr:hypothetical protein [Pseudomonadota bacterium]